MSYKIVVDSCCERPVEYKNDSRFEIVPLGLEVGDYIIQDDENFNQREFLQKVAATTARSWAKVSTPKSTARRRFMWWIPSPQAVGRLSLWKRLLPAKKRGSASRRR